MKVILSTTYDDNYFFYVPIVTWAWNRLGYDVVCFLPIFESINDLDKFDLCTELKIQGKIKLKYKSWVASSKQDRVLYSQCVRLYAADNNFQEEEILLTSDIDMLPISDYWLRNPSEFIAYGRDLTDYHFPICYLSGSVKKWKEIMNLTGDVENDMKRDFHNEPFASSTNTEQVWVTDQEIITKKLLSRNDIIRVDRGTDKNTGYPKGRIDRSAWQKSLLQPERIDAHLFREGYKEENWVRILKLIVECFNPTYEEIKWMDDYRNEYLKLL